MIYLDNNATTQPLTQVIKAMEPYLYQDYGNPSAIHELGSRARKAMEKARHQIAQVLRVPPTSLTFCSSGTEADNAAIAGTLWAMDGHRKKVLISSVEHDAVAATAQWLGRFGFEVTVVPIRWCGHGIDPEPFVNALDENTALLSMMHTNNETGVILPVEEVFSHARALNIVCHTDAVQSFGKVACFPEQLGCHLLSLSAHKFHGPKGIGLLYRHPQLPFVPLIHGGSQENTRRAGTENVAGIVGMAEAMTASSPGDAEFMAGLRDRFEVSCLEVLGKRIRIPFQDRNRVPNTSSVQFPGQDANLLLIKLDQRGICASTGAACHSGALSTSPVLLAMGVKPADAAATIRFSFSKLNTENDVDQAVTVLQDLLR